MSSDDAHKGGSLAEMAEKGTTIPGDAGVQRLIPSVPRPDQVDTDSTTSSSLAAAADNATDMPRSTRDTGMTGEVVTGTGDQLPARAIEHKNLAGGGNEPLAKGHSRYAKHARQNITEEDKMASEGPDVQEAPGEEGLDQDELRGRREGVARE